MCLFDVVLMLLVVIIVVVNDYMNFAEESPEAYFCIKLIASCCYYGKYFMHLLLSFWQKQYTIFL